MCIDATTSLQTFIIGSSSAVLLSYYKKYKYISNLLLFISFMQLAEYFMWIDISCKRNYNKLGNIIGLLSLTGQILNIAIVNKQVRNTDIISIIIMLYILIRYIQKNLPCSTEGSNKHLKWGFITSLSFFEKCIFVMYFLLLSMFWGFYDKTIIMFPLFILLFLYSVNITGSNIYDVNKWGSFWCYLCNIVGPLLLIKEWMYTYL